MEEKVTREVAEKEFEGFCEAMELDIDTERMDMEDKKDFDRNKSKIVNAIIKGSLSFNDDSEPVFTPQMGADKTAITFGEPTGATLQAMDKVKKNEDVSKMYGIMAQMTKTSAVTFSKMKNRDLKICQSIAILFLA